MGGRHARDDHAPKAGWVMLGTALAASAVAVVAALNLDVAAVMPGTAAAAAAAAAVPAGHGAGHPAGDGGRQVGAGAAALEACASSLVRAERALAAAAPAHAAWSRHVGAVFDVEAGRITFADSARTWTAVTATTDGDIAGFRTALADHRRVADDCDGLPLAVGGADAAQACLDRRAGLISALELASRVVDDWESHVAVLNAFTGDREAYLAMCRSMVAAGQPDLTAFTHARDGVPAGPVCSTA